MLGRPAGRDTPCSWNGYVVYIYITVILSDGHKAVEDDELQLQPSCRKRPGCFRLQETVLPSPHPGGRSRGCARRAAAAAPSQRPGRSRPRAEGKGEGKGEGEWNVRVSCKRDAPGVAWPRHTAAVVCAACSLGPFLQSKNPEPCLPGGWWPGWCGWRAQCCGPPARQQGAYMKRGLSHERCQCNAAWPKHACVDRRTEGHEPCRPQPAEHDATGPKPQVTAAAPCVRNLHQCHAPA